MIQHYACGFLFSQDRTRVVLIRKRRPAWQAGKLNGVGGKKGPDLTTIFQKKDEQLIRNQIYDPRSVKPDGTMPPAKISDHELDMVVQYLKESGQSHR